MSLSIEEVKKLFEHLKTGKIDLFFNQVADNVTWKVMGTRPLAGVYHNKKDFIAKSFTRLNGLLKGGLRLQV